MKYLTQSTFWIKNVGVLYTNITGDVLVCVYVCLCVCVYVLMLIMYLTF